MAEKIKVFHNPRCSKSRELVAFLTKKELKFDLVEYLKNRLSAGELTAIAKALDDDVDDMIRTNEPAYKSLKVKPKDSAEIVKATQNHPELLQRPIVLIGKRAVIARPAELVLEIL